MREKIYHGDTEGTEKKGEFEPRRARRTQGKKEEKLNRKARKGDAKTVRRTCDPLRSYPPVSLPPVSGLLSSPPLFFSVKLRVLRVSVVNPFFQQNTIDSRP
jgi:hypothetical protein